MKYFILLFLLGCSSMNYNKTVPYVDIPKFMGKWYVIAGRFTFLEKGVHNGIETYTWNKEKNRVDIGFNYNRDDFNGEPKSIPQKGWIYNQDTNSHWKISPFWPLKFDYLVIDLAKDYSWTVIGVPSGNYLWIMAREKQLDKSTYDSIIKRLEKNGYPTNNIIFVPHSK